MFINTQRIFNKCAYGKLRLLHFMYWTKGKYKDSDKKDTILPTTITQLKQIFFLCQVVAKLCEAILMIKQFYKYFQGIS